MMEKTKEKEEANREKERSRSASASAPTTTATFLTPAAPTTTAASSRISADGFGSTAPAASPLPIFHFLSIRGPKSRR